MVVKELAVPSVNLELGASHDASNISLHCGKVTGNVKKHSHHPGAVVHNWELFLMQAQE